METVHGTYRNGQVVLEREVNWPNGSPLEVRHGSIAPSTLPAEREDRCFDGSLPPSNPEEVEEWLKWFDSIEPFDWNEDERSRFERSLRESDEISKADMLKEWSVEGAAS